MWSKFEKLFIRSLSFVCRTNRAFHYDLKLSVTFACVAVIIYTVNVCKDARLICTATAVIYIGLKPNPNSVNHQIWKLLWYDFNILWMVIGQYQWAIKAGEYTVWICDIHFYVNVYYRHQENFVGKTKLLFSVIVSISAVQLWLGLQCTCLSEAPLCVYFYVFCDCFCLSGIGSPAHKSCRIPRWHHFIKLLRLW